MVLNLDLEERSVALTRRYTAIKDYFAGSNLGHQGYARLVVHGEHHGFSDSALIKAFDEARILYPLRQGIHDVVTADLAGAHLLSGRPLADVMADCCFTYGLLSDANGFKSSVQKYLAANVVLNNLNISTLLETYSNIATGFQEMGLQIRALALAVLAVNHVSSDVEIADLSKAYFGISKILLEKTNQASLARLATVLCKEQLSPREMNQAYLAVKRAVPKTDKMNYSATVILVEGLFPR